jgi:hypothetical protein
MSISFCVGLCVQYDYGSGFLHLNFMALNFPLRLRLCAPLRFSNGPPFWERIGVSKSTPESHYDFLRAVNDGHFGHLVIPAVLFVISLRCIYYLEYDSRYVYTAASSMPPLPVSLTPIRSCLLSSPLFTKQALTRRRGELTGGKLKQRCVHKSYIWYRYDKRILHFFYNLLFEMQE